MTMTHTYTKSLECVIMHSYAQVNPSYRSSS